MRAGSPDAAALRAALAEAVRRYEQVAQAHPKSEAAGRARRSRDHLAEWQVRLDAALARFAEVDAAARAEAEQSRFGAAAAFWPAYRRETDGKALKSPFEDGRYGDLLLGAAADARVRDLSAAAAAAFRKLHEEAAALAAAGKFDEAKALYARAESAFGDPETAERARREIAALDKRIVEKLDRDRREAAERERLRAEADAKRLAAALQAAQDPLKRYEFRKAADGLRAAAAALELESSRASAAARLEALEFMARLKAELIRRANAKAPGRDFIRTVKTKTLTGDIAGATEDVLTLVATVGGGRVELPQKWPDFPPAEFCGLFRRRWAMTAPDLIGLGCLYREYGLAEEADAAFKQAQEKAADDATRAALARLLSGAAPASPDAEADRLLQRLRSSLGQKKYDQVRTDGEALLRDYAETETVKKARAEIEAALQSAAERLQQGDDKARRSERLQKVREAMAAELKDAQARRREVLLHLKALRDDVEIQHHLALQTAAWQEWREAEVLFEGLRAAIEPKIQDYIDNSRPWQFCAMWHAIVRNATMAGDAARADRLVRTMDTRQPPLEPWRQWMARETAEWRRETFPAGAQEVKRLRAALEDDPANPDTLWRLCGLLAYAVPLRLDERQHLRALEAADPENPHAANGDLAYRLAENYFAFREFPHAHALYAKLQASHPDHPKVRDTKAGDAVGRRLAECEELMERMNYRK
jgi:hypothetical protein